MDCGAVVPLNNKNGSFNDRAKKYYTFSEAMECASDQQKDRSASPRVRHDEQSNSMSSKPWASGRSLTHAQRERKRAVDRRAQRSRRKWIAETEDKIESLMSALVNKCHAEELPPMGSFNSESREFAHVPSRRSISSGDNIENRSDNHSAAASPESTLTFLQAHDGQSWPQDYAVTVNSRSKRVNMNQTPLPMSEVHHLRLTDLNPRPGSVDYDVPVLTSHAKRTLDTTSLCNLELEKLNRISKYQISLEEQTNQDTLIRAILQGWETIVILCPLWAILRQIDSLIFESSSNITRFVMLTTIHRMLIVSGTIK
jgi:hypothetical protein